MYPGYGVISLSVHCTLWSNLCLQQIIATYLAHFLGILTSSTETAFQL